MENYVFKFNNNDAKQLLDILGSIAAKDVAGLYLNIMNQAIEQEKAHATEQEKKSKKG